MMSTSNSDRLPDHLDDLRHLRFWNAFSRTLGWRLFQVLLLIAALSTHSASSFAQASNNNFANAISLSGSSGSIAGNNISATQETGEPSVSVNGQINSVWYNWTAPSAGTLNLNTCTRNYDTFLAVFTGSTVSGLSLVTSNDDSCGLGSIVNFSVVGGTTYRIQVDGFSTATGTFTLAYAFTPAAPALTVTPAGNFAASGNQGGPFTTTSPPSGQYTIRNTGGGTLNWSTSSPPPWLNFSASSGSLGAGASQTITVSVNTGATLANTYGTHSGNISFTSNGGSAARTATVTVNDVVGPTITGTPGNVSLNTPPGSATATHSWTPPTAADNTGGSGLNLFNVTLSGAATAGPVTAASLTSFAFPIGVTTVTYTARDNVNNNATPRSFTVTVIDNVQPVIAACPANQTLEATGPAGAVATWTAPTASDNSGSVTLVRTGPAPGSTFSLGTTPVTYTATDPSSNAALCTFNIVVQDTIGPVFAGVPANVTLEATSPAGVTFAYTLPTATDLVSGNRTVTAVPPDNAFLFTAPGPTATTVTFSASDAAGNGTSAQFTVTVRDTTPPTVTPPANVTVEATGPGGAVVTYAAATATDIADPAPVLSYSQASGTNFPIGTTIVSVTATDASANTSAASTFTVTVVDTTAPQITNVPANITVFTPPGSNTAVATWTAPTATDAVGVTSFTSNFAPGASFPVGTTTVTYTATDAAGNGPTTASFTVTVIDNVAPVFAGVPSNVTVEATGPSGAVVSYSMPTATDAVDGPRTVTTSHPSGSSFPIGTTTVTFSASDLASPPNIATATFQVTVQDTTPPVIGTVSNITVTAPNLTGAVVNFTLPSASDIVDTSPTVTAAPASGSLFTIGVHTVTVTAVDDYANQSQKTFTVTVLSPAQMAVTPATGLVSTGPQGQQGGSFSPASQSYVVTNNGQVPMDFTVTGGTAWVAPAPASGTIPPGGSVTVVVALTAGADALAVGVHNASLTFNNTTSNIGSTSRDVALTVVAPAAMSMTPATAFVASGPQGQQGGLFTPASTSYVVQNTGALPMTFSVSGAPPWVTLSAVGGTLAPGATQSITVSFNAAANGLPVGAHTGTLTFTNATNAIGNTTRGVTLNVLEPARLTVTPADGLAASGFQGGPFAPSTKTFTLSNTGAFPLDFSAADDQGWLDVAPVSGTIPANGTLTVTLSINAAANALASGTHNGTLTLTNVTSGLGTTTRPAVITVVPNGQVILKVVTSEGDGPFAFSSATGSLAMTLTTSGGNAQSSPVTLNPGTYGVTVTPPDGFGITAISCSDGDSTGNASAKSASIVLASAESVTCTFTAANSRKKTVEVITRFMGQRNDLLLSNGPDPNRQIDRLIEASGGNAGGGEAGFSGGSKPLGVGMAPSRLGSTGDASFNSSFAAPGVASAQRGPSSGPTGGPRSFDDRLDALGVAPSAPRDEQGGLSPIRVTGNTDGASRFSFATSLSQMARVNDDIAARKAKDAALADGGEPMALGAGKVPGSKRAFSPLDIWAEGHFLSFADNRNSADTDGHFGVFYVGADYIVKPWLLVGLLAQYDTMHQRSTTQAFDIKGSGWMAGPYATVRLSENIFLQGRLAAGRSTNEVSPFLTYTDTFSTKRWLATTALVGRWQVGNWQIQPSATLSHIEDVSEAYTDTLGVGIPGLKASLGQFKAGPQVSYRHVLADGTLLEPRFGAELIWNFTASDKVADFGGTLSGPEELRGRIELGLRTQFTNGVGLDLSGSYDGIGSDTFHALGAKATVRVPLN